MNRTAFLKLGITLTVGGAWLPGCASDGDSKGRPGRAGAGPTAGGSSNGGAGGVAGAGASEGGGATATAGTAGTAAGNSARAGSGPSAGQCSTDANLVQTSMESHDHLPLTSPITAQALNAGSPTEFALALDQNHIHTLSFTPADFVALRAGMMIMKRSSSMMGHTHTYSIKCV